VRIGERVLLAAVREQHQLGRSRRVPDEIDTRTPHGRTYNSAGSLRIAIIRPGGVSLKPYDR
jgi:hypothetical protein